MTDNLGILLIHSDTTDGATTFEDSSGQGHIITPAGNTHHETDQKKFGATSIYFDGSGDYLSVPTSDDFDFGTGDFTIDWWFRAGTVTGDDGMFSIRQSTSSLLSARCGGGNPLLVKINGANYTYFVSVDTWYHIALVRYGNTLTIYLDGTAIHAVGVTGLSFDDNNSGIWIGAYYSTAYTFAGYIDEFRIVKGTAVWTSDFTPKTSIYFDGILIIPEITLSCSANTDTQVNLALPEIEIQSVADCGVFAGVALSIPEISAVSSADSDIKLNLSLPEITAAASTETDFQIGLALPEITVASISGCDIFAGIPIAIPEITLNSTGDCTVLLSVSLPEITTITGVETDFRIILALPEISVLSAGSMDDVVSFQTGDAIIRYFLTITGSADSTADVDIPLESFQARRRSGNPTYLQAIVPSVDFVDYITDRPNGTMQISQGYELNGDVLQREIIIETEIERADTYQGGQNNSIVLIGYTTSTFSGKSITLDQATYRSSVKGKIHYRLAEPNIFLNPGDSVTIGTDTFTVGVMSYAISATTQQIEIEEA